MSQVVGNSDQSVFSCCWAAHYSKICGDGDFIIPLIFHYSQEDVVQVRTARTASEGIDGGKTDRYCNTGISHTFENIFLNFGRHDAHVTQSFKTAQSLNNIQHIQY